MRLAEIGGGNETAADGGMCSAVVRWGIWRGLLASCIIAIVVCVCVCVCVCMSAMIMMMAVREEFKYL